MAVWASEMPPRFNERLSGILTVFYVNRIELLKELLKKAHN